MSSFNKVILLGTMTRDPEARYTQKGTCIAKFSLALNRVWKNEVGEQKEKVTFVECDAFGRTGENIAQYFQKGSRIHIEGRLKLDVWDDKQTGQKRSRLGVVAESFQFIDRRDKSEDQRAPGSRPAPYTPKPKNTEPSASTDGGPPLEEDDVPF